MFGGDSVLRRSPTEMGDRSRYGKCHDRTEQLPRTTVDIYAKQTAAPWTWFCFFPSIPFLLWVTLYIYSIMHIVHFLKEGLRLEKRKKLVA